MKEERFNIPDSLIGALKNGRVIPFVGSGISRAIERKTTGVNKSYQPLFPNWKEYVEILVTELIENRKIEEAKFVKSRLESSPPKYLEAMQVAFDELGEAVWDELLDKHFDIEIKESDAKSLLLSQLIWQLGSNLVFTTNIDKVLQWTCPNPNEFRSLNTQTKEFGKLHKEIKIKYPTVIYLHGRIDNKDSIIFTRDAYRKFYDDKINEAKLETLKTFLTRRTFLFLGFSLDDPYFLGQLNYFHCLYKGAADSLFVLIHKSEKDNPNIPDFVRKIIFEDYGQPLLNLINYLASFAPRDAAVSKEKLPRAISSEFIVNTENTTEIVNDKPSNKSSLSKKAKPKKRPNQISVRQNFTVQGRKYLNHRLLIILAALLIIAGLIWSAFKYNSLSNDSPIDSIAILPFQNDSSEPDTDYLSDGLTSELNNILSQQTNLKISPPSLVTHYKNNLSDPVKIGNELNVRAVVTGFITQRGDSLTIRVQLTDVLNKQYKWGKRYDSKVSDLLKTHQDIANAIAQELKLKLSGENVMDLTQKYTNNNEAYRLYIKGNHYFKKRNKADILDGIKFFKQAKDLDPEFALAYVGIANAYNATLAFSYVSPEEALPQAKDAATKAVDIDPLLAEAHSALAYSLVIFDRNWVEAEKHFKRALELKPQNPDIHFRYGMIYLMAKGDSKKAIKELQKALELDSESLVYNSILVTTYLYGQQNERQYELALAQATYTYELEPNFVLGRWNLGYAYIVNGMYDDAIRLSDESLLVDPTAQFMLRIKGIAYAKSGQKEEALKVIKRFEEISTTQYAVSYYVASIYAALNEKEKAFAELDKSFSKNDWDLHRLKVDPFMDPLRNDSRFNEKLRLLNLLE